MSIHQLFKDNEKLIYKISTYFYNVDKKDLYQAGLLGLLKAYNNYHQNATCKFSSYAYDYIYGEMYNLANNRLIKTNSKLLKLYNMIEKARYTLAQKYERVPSNEEVASFLNIDISIIENALLSNNNVVSIENEESSLLDIIPNEENISLDDKISLKMSMDTLTDIERSIIEGKYYLDLTQDEIARKLGITQVKVSRYMKRSLTKMHDYLSA